MRGVCDDKNIGCRFTLDTPMAVVLETVKHVPEAWVSRSVDTLDTHDVHIVHDWLWLSRDEQEDVGTLLCRNIREVIAQEDPSGSFQDQVDAIKMEADRIARERKREADRIAWEEEIEEAGKASERKREADRIARERKREANCIARERKREAKRLKLHQDAKACE